MMYFLSKMRTAASVLKGKSVIQNAIRHSGGQWVYRRLAPPPPKYIFWQAEALGAIMWYWILYHLYKEPEHIYGHFPYPDPSTWSDEELGVPPDCD